MRLTFQEIDASISLYTVYCDNRFIGSVSSLAKEGPKGTIHYGGFKQTISGDTVADVMDALEKEVVRLDHFR
jgi:hypothetical protein